MALFLIMTVMTLSGFEVARADTPAISKAKTEPPAFLEAHLL
jgi:hypothetical protein